MNKTKILKFILIIICIPIFFIICIVLMSSIITVLRAYMWPFPINEVNLVAATLGYENYILWFSDSNPNDISKTYKFYEMSFDKKTQKLREIKLDLNSYIVNYGLVQDSRDIVKGSKTIPAEWDINCALVYDIDTGKRVPINTFIRRNLLLDGRTYFPYLCDGFVIPETLSEAENLVEN